MTNVTKKTTNTIEVSVTHVLREDEVALLKSIHDKIDRVSACKVLRYMIPGMRIDDSLNNIKQICKEN
jgi:hypothetical protein